MKVNLKEDLSYKEEFKYYDEFFSVRYYYKKLKVNPERKIMTFSKKTIYYIALIIMINLLVFYLSFSSNSIIPLIYLGVSLGFIFFAVYGWLNLRKGIRKIILDEKRTTSTDFNEKRILYNCKTSTMSQEYEIEWDSIEYIICNKYCIMFLPKSKEGIIFGCHVIFKDKIINILKKYDKMDLFVDNTNLYK